jgi:hypothetical protein
MYKSAAELEQEARARIERLYADVETFRLLRQHRALPRQRIATLLRKLADHLDLSTSAQTFTKAKQ